MGWKPGTTCVTVFISLVWPGKEKDGRYRCLDLWSRRLGRGCDSLRLRAEADL